MTSRLQALGLLVALAGTTAVAVAAATGPDRIAPDHRAGVGNLAVTGAAQTNRVNPCARPVYVCLPTRKLERLGRWVATHGGVTGTCKGCATRYMQGISLALVMRAFPARTKGWAVCIVLRESGANPGAISASDDYGLPQFHYGTWPVNERRLLRDPGYAARAFARVSRWGSVRWPWDGGAYAC